MVATFPEKIKKHSGKADKCAALFCSMQLIFFYMYLKSIEEKEK
jgi:hypothetical protein